jgi:hypothetical protein
MAEMTVKERLMTALTGGTPDRVPFSPNLTRWVRKNRSCVCIRHMYQANAEFGFDPILQLYPYTWQNLSNNYVYTPGGGYNYSSSGLYGDLPEVNADIRITNEKNWVIYERTFKTPAGTLNDVIRWCRSDIGYGDGPNPHREVPLLKSCDDLDAYRYLYPAPRKDLIADIPIIIKEFGDKAVIATADSLQVGSWGTEALGPEGMLFASIDDPDLLIGACRIANDAHLANLKACLDAGIRVVYDSWFQCSPSTGWKPSTYENVFLPLVRECIDLTHQYGALYIYQDDGKMNDYIPLIVDAGVDVVSGLQPPTVGDVVLADVKRKFGKKVALFGGLDPCYTFDMGTMETVKTGVISALRDGAPGGGYVLGTAEAVDPVVPVEMLIEASRVAKEYGKY